MKLKQLQTFVGVAEHGSLARAAAASDQAESLISRHVGALETEWGDRLFERTGRGFVSLDADGTAVLAGPPPEGSGPGPDGSHVIELPTMLPASSATASWPGEPRSRRR